MARQSVGSLSNRSACSSLGSLSCSVDASFVSLGSNSSGGSASYELESEVGREALREICCSALSRLLDFPDSHLETLLGFDEENEKREDDSGLNVARNIATSLRHVTQSISSGLTALTHIYHHRQNIHELRETSPECEEATPTLRLGAAITSSSQLVLLQLISHVQSFLHHEGIFRRPGNKNRMDTLIHQIGEGGVVACLSNEAFTAHDYASVLKQCLAELPEPLLLRRHQEAYLQAATLSAPHGTARCLQLLMLLLPPAYRVILQHLLALLTQVAACQENKMDAHNLALVFAPTLFLSSRIDAILPGSLEKLTTLLKYMITNAEEIFEVPAEVQVVADRYCKTRRTSKDEDIPLEMYSTSCKRVSSEDFHTQGKEQALAEVAALYEFVQKMLEGPQKSHFLKRFESGSKCTGSPKPFVRSSSRSHKNKENMRGGTPIDKALESEKLSKSAQAFFRRRTIHGFKHRPRKFDFQTPSTDKGKRVLNESQTTNVGVFEARSTNV